MNTPDEMVIFLHERMRGFSAAVMQARRNGCRNESAEEWHDMYAAIKHFITTHEDIKIKYGVTDKETSSLLDMLYARFINMGIDDRCSFSRTELERMYETIKWLSGGVKP